MSHAGWRNAVFVLFAFNGIAAASWASRTPGIAEGLGIGVGQMGALITGLPVGSMAAILLSSHVMHALGSRRTARLAMLAMASGIVLIGLGAGPVASYPLAFLGFFVFGFANSMQGVVINVEAAEIDRMSSRTLMPLFHATFSVGTFLGAGAGALATLAAVPLLVQFSVTALLLVGGALFAVAQLPALETVHQVRPPTTFRARMGVWLEPRTLLIGVVVLGAAFTEGTANNWLALAMVQDRGLTAAAGAAYLTVFTGSMMVGRFAGGFVVDRIGRVASLRIALVLAVAGLLLVVLVPWPVGAIAGVVLWGLGASLGYPLGISAAADDPVNAAARVSAVAAVGALAFLLGPSIIGIIGQHSSLLTAFLVVGGLIAASLAASSAARPLPGSRHEELATGPITEIV
ncbi:MFS transporter [soil metagenome]